MLEIPFLISLEQAPEALGAFLQQHGLLDAREWVLRLEKPGEGNMNVVLRVVTDKRRFILKQARPYVQKYPQIAAPKERILVEGKFYQLVSGYPAVCDNMPALLYFDPENYLLAVEDLGEGADCTFVYKKGQNLSDEELARALDFLTQLHNAPFPDAVRAGFPDNLALRRLNHEHLCVYPFLSDKGFDLDSVLPGLRAAATPHETDTALKQAVVALGARYLSAGKCLLHGDYYPGSWLRSAAGFRVIDPEFCFFGPPEYDLGVFSAHLAMAQAPERQLVHLHAHYKAPAGFDFDLCRAFTGLEILRRIIGLAQLPLDLDLKERVALLEYARGLVMEKNGFIA
jgi:5-methylthioribose kinase